MILPSGAQAPDFTLPDQYGAPVSLAALTARAPVALVFFPLAFSGICRGELCELRDHLPLFRDAKVELVGVSVDSKFALRAWGEQEGFDFPLLADFWPHGEVARAYGAFREDAGTASRASFVIERDGRIRASFASAPGEARPLAAYREAIAGL
ncbi:peroxiredoxin [Agromyces mediolanus]|uniref:peroxiredoxin n=1 Tax=Agromyces mediolanus TaxID=41986 RepID=UPI0038383360